MLQKNSVSEFIEVEDFSTILYRPSAAQVLNKYRTPQDNTHVIYTRKLTLPDAPTSKNQRNRLTSKGKALQKQLKK